MQLIKKVSAMSLMISLLTASFFSNAGVDSVRSSQTQQPTVFTQGHPDDPGIDTGSIYEQNVSLSGSINEVHEKLISNSNNILSNKNNISYTSSDLNTLSRTHNDHAARINSLETAPVPNPQCIYDSKNTIKSGYASPEVIFNGKTIKKDTMLSNVLWETIDGKSFRRGKLISSNYIHLYEICYSDVIIPEPITECYYETANNDQKKYGLTATNQGNTVYFEKKEFKISNSTDWNLHEGEYYKFGTNRYNNNGHVRMYDICKAIDFK
ncbi:hypothetical protein [Photobacterium lutimaris]|uniref:Uncharacterized protein n=1 Tax=Photobacterium lutimaris TaxID=388278 RepID=A0A2T3ITS3_9GAMM|nr:hypothetical protein [Photobacterium lutimaris]PSU31742.1 hypothetical protein C9I99_21390 [Photobacterium lutimaris]TDR72614.1 hypothetical protein DFP78_11390 [Photobacterium lutimaris]